MNSHAVTIVRAPKPVEHPPHADRRLWIPRILTTVVKFALDSAANSPLKGMMGGKKVYKIVEEEIKGNPSALDLNDKMLSELRCVREEMRAKMEKLQEDMNIVMQQNRTSTEDTTRSESFKKTPNEIKGSELLKTDEKRIFIRSRL